MIWRCQVDPAHKKTGKVFFMLRQEKTRDLVASARQLKLLAGSERDLVCWAIDLSDGARKV